MKHIKLFEAFISEDSSEGQIPAKHFLLDGASSAGKSSALKDLDKSWCILAVDSFYNVMFEELGMEDFGNSGKPTISEIYPGCPYEYSGPDDAPSSRKCFAGICPSLESSLINDSNSLICFIFLLIILLFSLVWLVLDTLLSLPVRVLDYTEPVVLDRLRPYRPTASQQLLPGTCLISSSYKEL